MNNILNKKIASLVSGKSISSTTLNSLYENLSCVENRNPIIDFYLIKEQYVSSKRYNQYILKEKYKNLKELLSDESILVEEQIFLEDVPTMTGGTGISQGNQGESTDDVAGYSTPTMNILTRKDITKEDKKNKKKKKKKETSEEK